MNIASYRSAKRSDAILQLIVLLVGVLMALSRNLTAFFCSYLVVGGLQMASWVYWLVLIRRHRWSVGRIAYTVALLVVVLWFCLNFYEDGNSTKGWSTETMYALLFITPGLALVYVVMAFVEYRSTGIGNGQQEPPVDSAHLP